MKNLYKPGDIVCAINNKAKPLVVRIMARNVYYCNVLNQPQEKEHVYFERELEFFSH